MNEDPIRDEREAFHAWFERAASYLSPEWRRLCQVALREARTPEHARLFPAIAEDARRNYRREQESR